MKFRKVSLFQGITNFKVSYRARPVSELTTDGRRNLFLTSARPINNCLRVAGCDLTFSTVSPVFYVQYAPKVHVTIFDEIFSTAFTRSPVH